jgi:hypothetical protein
VERATHALRLIYTQDQLCLKRQPAIFEHGVHYTDRLRAEVGVSLGPCHSQCMVFCSAHFDT